MKKGTENIKNLKKGNSMINSEVLGSVCLTLLIGCLQIHLVLLFRCHSLSFRYHEFFVHIFKTKTFCCIQSHCYRKIKLICILSSFLHIQIAKFIALVCITFSFDRYKDLKGSPIACRIDCATNMDCNIQMLSPHGDCKIIRPWK